MWSQVINKMIFIYLSLNEISMNMTKSQTDPKYSSPPPFLPKISHDPPHLPLTEPIPLSLIASLRSNCKYKYSNCPVKTLLRIKGLSQSQMICNTIWISQIASSSVANISICNGSYKCKHILQPSFLFYFESPKMSL